MGIELDQYGFDGVVFQGLHETLRYFVFDPINIDFYVVGALDGTVGDQFIKGEGYASLTKRRNNGLEIMAC